VTGFPTMSKEWGAYARDPYWVVLRHAYTKLDGTRVAAGTRALYWPGQRMMFGDEAETFERDYAAKVVTLRAA
jgi:hypothetical protein